VRGFPLRRSVDELRSFAEELSTTRKDEANQFYQEYGLSYESWHLQDTPSGPWVLCVSVVERPDEAGPRYATASADFHAWFKAMVLHLTGIDPSSQPLGPPTTEIFRWSEADKSGL